MAGLRRAFASLLAAALAAGGVGGGVAIADPARELERARQAAIAAPEPARLCDLGLAYAAAAEPARALLYLARCPPARDTPALRATRARAARAVDAAELGRIAISSEPDGAAVALASLPGDPPLAAPVEVHLPPGRHHIEVTAAGRRPFAVDVEVTGRERQAIFARLAPLAAAAGAPAVATADFTADEPAAADGVLAVPDPRPKKHATLLPDRYRERPGAGEVAGGGLVDPEAGRPRPAPSARRTPWLIAGGLAAAALIVGVVVVAR